MPLRRPRSKPSSDTASPTTVVPPVGVPLAPPSAVAPGAPWGPSAPPAPSPGRADRVALPAAPSSVTPTLLVRARPLDALLTGIAAAAVGGALWWAAVAFSHREFPYLALLVGVLAGQGVLVGARRGGIPQGLLAAVFCLGSLAVAQYFVQRSLFVADAGSGSSVPLWLGFDAARTIVTDSVREHAVTGLFFAIAVVAAAVTAGSTSRRPIVA